MTERVIDTNSKTQRIALFGGSFDPIHIGHLIMAQDAVEGLDLDELVFLPANESPLKGRSPVAGPSDRLEMVRATIAENPSFSVSDFELKSPKPSYSVVTARHFAQNNPHAKLFWLIGADQAEQLGEWRSIDELKELVEFAVFDRASIDYEKKLRALGIAFQTIANRSMDISSTEIRDRLARNLPANNFLPASTLGIITSRNLYQTRTKTHASP